MMTPGPHLGEESLSDLTAASSLRDRISAFAEKVNALTDAPSYVEPQTSAERVAHKLRAAIKFGTYPPGTRLREIALSEEFEVSRGPVREALQTLVTEGLVTIEAHRGARVTQIDRQSLMEVFDIREALLGILHRRAAENAHRSPEIVALMREAVALMDDAAKPDIPVSEFLETRTLFGTIALHLADNRRAAVMADHLEQIVPTHHKFLTAPERREVTVAMCRQMLDAVSRGDGPAAEDAVRHAVRRAREDSLSLPEYSLKAAKGPRAP